MKPEKPAIKLTIFGNEYTIRGDAEEEYIRRLAGYVNEKMNEIAEATPLTSPLKVSILTTMNLADEIFRLREEAGSQKQSESEPSTTGLPVSHPISMIPPEAISALSVHIENALKKNNYS